MELGNLLKAAATAASVLGVGSAAAQERNVLDPVALASYFNCIVPELDGADKTLRFYVKSPDVKDLGEFPDEELGALLLEANLVSLDHGRFLSTLRGEMTDVYSMKFLKGEKRLEIRSIEFDAEGNMVFGRSKDYDGPRILVEKGIEYLGFQPLDSQSIKFNPDDNFCKTYTERLVTAGFSKPAPQE